MASADKRKRKRIKPQKMLIVDDHVEIRSEEEGFEGSWHSAVVVACGNGYREVKYTYLIDQDGSSPIYARVKVSPSVEGLSLEIDHSEYRGFIRPVPPAVECGIYSIPYGSCVDVSYRDAWWEGVVFDNEDGATKRRIFFPDLGDEMEVEISSIRVTQEWNEVNGEWKQRGIWYFLELIEEYEKCYLSVRSIRQLWYDVRGKEGFKKLMEWTSSDRAAWKNLVADAIDDSTDDYLSLVFQSTDLACEPTQYNRQPAELTNCCAVVPFDVSSRTTGDGPAEHCNFSSGSVTCPDPNVDANPVKSTPSFPCADDSVVNKKPKQWRSRDGLWLPADHERLPGKRFFPNITEEYVHASEGKKKPKPPLSTNVRMHLSFCGWRIEEMKDKGGMIKKRYTSPEGKHYFSLRKACLEFIEPSMEIVSSAQINPEDTISPGDASFPTLLEEPKEFEDFDHSPMPLLPHYSDAPDVEPEYCPQAVLEYVNMETKTQRNRKTSSIRLKAKQHLVATGWKLRYREVKRKRAINYLSPANKSYFALSRACRACIKAGDCYMDGDTGMRKCLPPPESFREKSRGRHGSLVSRELVEGGKFKKRENRKFRTKGRKCKSQSAPFDSIQIRAEADSPSTSKKSLTGLVGKNKLSNLNDQNPNSNRSKRRKADSSRPARALRSSIRARQVEIPSSSLYGPRTELSWLIDNNVVLPRARVYYSDRKDGEPVKEGRITREGIICKCCRNLFDPRDFEAHAGSKYQRPCAYIYLEDGRSLLDCQKQVINSIQSRDNTLSGLKQGENDSVCSICHYGGELVLCDQCPSSFHKSCLGLEDVPVGEWFCPSCCCGICGQRKFKEGTENLTDDTINCLQCEHKYHASCLQRAGGFMLDEYPMKGWFCGKKCKKIFLGLHELLGKRISVGTDNLTWTLLKSTTSESPVLDVNVEALTEIYSKLKFALDGMHECFEPIKELYTGRDLVEDVVFSKGSKLNRLNFLGFYTAILERNDELVTVATVRVYGEKVAEIPLIGTRFQYRRLGMCRILMSELEKKLTSMGVERLVLPAVPSMLKAWTTSFGFSKMEDSTRLQYLKYIFLGFQDTVMCHKILSEKPITDPILQRDLDVNVNGDTVGIDGSSPVSEVFQEESRIMEQ